MKERAKRKGSYKIVRFIALILSVVCASVSLFICASALGTPSFVVSSLVQPVPVVEGVDRHYYMIMQYDTSTSTAVTLRGSTILVDYHLVFQSEPSLQFSTYGGWGGMHIISTVPFTATVSQTNVVTGSVLGSNSYTSGTNQYFPNKYLVSSSTIPDFNHLSGYYFLDNTVTSMPSQASPFVTFSPPVPDQTQYRSSLPAPVWDVHNRYIVINDELFWLSLYIDNLWVNPITGSVSQSSDNLTAVVTGNASDPTDGDLYYNYNVSITYQDKEYYCAQYNGIDYSFEDMCCPALIYSSSGSRLTISFDQLSGIYSSIQDILVDYRIYCSSFDLVSGEYIESVYSAQGQVGNADININISCPDSIESIYCYGVEFQNPQNLPVNLGSVLWSYDLDFASWRTDIASKLDAIYALLSQTSVPTTSAPKDYGTAVSDVSDLPTYNASDVVGVLNSAVSDVNANLSSGIEWGQGWFARIYHDIPELFIVVVLALAFGLVLLVLGKKKSDS